MADENLTNQDELIIGQQYLARFQDLKDYEDEYEERISSVVSGVHFKTKQEMQTWLDKGYQKITEEEQYALVNDGVRRKSDNAIVHRPPIVVPLQGRINQLLSQIDNYTAEQITGGFIFEVTSTIPNGPLGLAKFDSAKEDQMTFSTMYAASKSPDFDTTEPYLGHIPMRGYPVIDSEPSDVKQVYYLDAENMQKFNDALALHIGSCKMTGWSLQQQANAATKETIDEIEQNIWQIIGYNPVPQE